MVFLKKYFLHSWKKYAVAVFLGTAIFLANLWINGFHIAINYMNGLFIAGFSLLCIGGLSTLNYFGAYDFFTYAFYRKKASMEYYNYIEQKQTKRKNNNIPFGPYFLIGVIFILISFTIQAIIL